MRILLRFLVFFLASTSAALFLFVAVAYVYNRFFVEYEYEMVGWPDKDDFLSPVEWKPDHPARVRVLAVEGGAMLGLADIEILMEMEKRSGKRIYEMFDFVAGTSTGAIISTLLLYPQPDTGQPLRAEAIADRYQHLGNKILSSSLLHRTLTVNGLFGPRMTNHARIIASEDAVRHGKFRDLLRPALFPAFSRREAGVRVLNNWHPDQANLFLAPLLAGATSAPTYFPAVRVIGHGSGTDYLTDAGLILNAPAEIAYVHARSNVPQAKEFIVVALGTTMDADFSTSTVIRGGFLEWLQPLIAMIFNGETSVSRISLTERGRIQSETDVVPFFWYPSLPDSIDPFGTAPADIRLIRQSGREFVEKHSEEIDEAIELLTDPQADLPEPTH